MKLLGSLVRDKITCGLTNCGHTQVSPKNEVHVGPEAELWELGEPECLEGCDCDSGAGGLQVLFLRHC